MHSAYFKLDSTVPLRDFHGTVLRVCCVTNSTWIVYLGFAVKKESHIKATWNQPFFLKSQLTERSGGADKAACLPRLANMASVPSAVRVQSVTVTAMDGSSNCECEDD